MSVELLNLVSIRELKFDDLKFILGTFIANLSCYTESIAKGYTKEYSKEHFERQILLALTGIPEVLEYSVFICCQKDDSDDIVSYLIGCPKTNHVFFSYTKYAFRKLGIQKLLLLPLIIDFDKPITVNYPTKDTLRMVKEGKVEIKNLFLDTLLHKERR